MVQSHSQSGGIGMSMPMPTMLSTWTNGSGCPIRRTTAVGFASEAVEGLRAVPFASLAVPDGTDAGNDPACDSTSAVVTATSTPYPGVDTKTVNGVTYTVDRCVEWTQATTSEGFRSVLKGGYWAPVRNRCRPATRAHGESFSYYQLGFRCCADLPKSEGR